jgi:hypothetical protein
VPAGRSDQEACHRAVVATRTASWRGPMIGGHGFAVVRCVPLDRCRATWLIGAAEAALVGLERA